VKVLMAASEAHPYVSTGGLAGVMGSLPQALAQEGHRVDVVIPFYTDIEHPDDLEWVLPGIRTMSGEEFGVARTVSSGGFNVYLVAKDEYFKRPGIYGPDDASAYADNDMRFAFFSRAVLAISEEDAPAPDIIHCHDWQTGLIPAYVRDRTGPSTVFTIHNLNYQGNFPADRFHRLMLPSSFFNMEGMEFYGSASFLKAGIVFSHQVTTVSRTYAREIRMPEYGHGMDGLLREYAGKLTGILNGIDTAKWDPARDPCIAASFDAGGITPRRRCRRELVKLTGLSCDTFIAGAVSRLTGQKGLDLLFPVMEKMKNSSFVVLGTGEKDYAATLKSLAERFPDRIASILRYDETMARKIFAGTDVILMPSRFEPCGLAQMIGMRYGAVPLVRRTGGLADTVKDVSEGGSGFVMEKATPGELMKALKRARTLFLNRGKWAWIVKRCMRRDNSWNSRVRPYLKVYENAVEKGR